MNKRLSVLFLLLFSVAFAQDIIDGIAAIVGENVILKSEVEQLARMNASQLRIDPRQDPVKFESLKKNALDALIDEKILVEQAKLDSIEVKDREVEAMLEQQIQGIISQTGSIDKAEEILGSPLTKIRKEYRPIIRNRLIVDKLRSEKFNSISISRREVNDFYKVYRDSMPDIPPTLDFSQILFQIKPGDQEQALAREKADSILLCIKTGDDFAALARQFSEDPGSATEGGDLGYISRGGFIKEFEEVAYSLEPQEISAVVKTTFGYHIIQLLDKKGEKINVRHILISPKVSEKNISDALDLAREIRKRLVTESFPFDSAAFFYSDDSDAKSNKGRIDRIPKNQIQNPEFLTILDSMKVADVSSVFRTDMGFHILKLNGIYDDSWHTIEQWALEYKKSDLYRQWISELRSQFYIDIK